MRNKFILLTCTTALIFTGACGQKADTTMVEPQAELVQIEEEESETPVEESEEETEASNTPEEESETTEETEATEPASISLEDSVTIARVDKSKTVTSINGTSIDCNYFYEYPDIDPSLPFAEPIAAFFDQKQKLFFLDSASDPVAWVEADIPGEPDPILEAVWTLIHTNQIKSIYYDGRYLSIDMREVSFYGGTNIDDGRVYTFDLEDLDKYWDGENFIYNGDVLDDPYTGGMGTINWEEATGMTMDELKAKISEGVQNHEKYVDNIDYSMEQNNRLIESGHYFAIKDGKVCYVAQKGTFFDNMTGTVSIEIGDFKGGGEDYYYFETPQDSEYGVEFNAANEPEVVTADFPKDNWDGENIDLDVMEYRYHFWDLPEELGLNPCQGSETDCLYGKGMVEFSMWYPHFYLHTYEPGIDLNYYGVKVGDNKDEAIEKIMAEGWTIDFEEDGVMVFTDGKDDFLSFRYKVDTSEIDSLNYQNFNDEY